MFDRPNRLPLRRTRQHKTNRPRLARTWRIIATVILIALASVYVAFAAISLSTSVPYTQDFTGMGVPSTNVIDSALPANFRLDTLATVRTLGTFSSAVTTTARVAGANVLTNAANGSYNFGAGTATLGDADRAVGFISSDTFTRSGNLYGQFVNNTGSALAGLQISYDVEKYRNGSNPAGFAYQLFYSLDGVNWTNAGPGFFTAFPGDANNNGFATVPGATLSITNKTLNVLVANGANVYLAWNYSVASGSSTINAQALAIDNISVLGIGIAQPTNPAGIGAANPNSVLPGETSTLTVSLTPGANPTSTGLAVSADLSSIGGSATQQFFDDGANGGDTVAGNNVFTYTATVALLTTPGAKSLPFTITDAQGRSASGSISLTVQQPLQPVDLGPGVAGTNPISDGFNVPYDATVTVDFSEPVDLTGNWFDITCASSGQHNSATVASYNSAKGFHITPNTSFQFGEQCTVTVFHTNVHDQDLDDGSPNTDTLFADHSWTFTVVAAGAPAPHAPSVHLAFGNPSNAVADLQQGNNYLMEKPSFSLSYNKDKGTPNWVSWHLENDWTGNLPRNDTFRADPAVSPDWYRVQSTDYFASGFDRGHMTPNADRDNPASLPLNQETFLMSNMVPQAPNSSQGPWADLENFLRTQLPANEVYIMAGPAGVGGSGDNGPANTIANGHVTVPGYMWKVALVLPLGDSDVSRVNASTRVIAVIMPNSNSVNSDWHTYLTTVDAVEALTGYDFFANVPDIVENSIEAGLDGNNPPGTDNQFATTAEDIPGDITLNAVSANATPTFTYTIVTQPAHGVLSGTGPTFTYTPAQDYNGDDSFTFKVNDGSHDSNTSTVNITVSEVNDAPVASDDAASTNEDSHVDLSAIDFAANDSTGPANESLQLLTVTSVSATGNTHGTVSLSNGIVTYTPDANFNGSASFEYQVCDNGNTNGSPDPQCSNGVVNVTVTPVNDAPSANSQSVTTNSNTPAAVTLSGNDLETATADLVFEVTVSPAHGSLSGSGANLTYTPNTNYSGPDSFQFTARDSGDGSAAALTSAAATVSITVNDTVAPVLNAPANVTVNTGAGATTCGAVVTEAQLGTATATDNAGSVSIERSGVPAGNVFPVGTTTISYTATDDAGNSSTATQTVTVIDNTAPTITVPPPTSANADGTGHATIPNVVAGTTASDNCGPVTVTQSPLAGTVVGVGTHTITVTATDAAGNTHTATTTFTVNGPQLLFSLSASPDTVGRNKTTKVEVVYTNTTNQKLTVSFVVRYAGPCDSGVIDQIGPSGINPGQTKNGNTTFHVSKTACTGVYVLTAEAYVGNTLVGTTTTELVVAPELAKKSRH